MDYRDRLERPQSIADAGPANPRPESIADAPPLEEATVSCSSITTTTDPPPNARGIFGYLQLPGKADMFQFKFGNYWECQVCKIALDCGAGRKKQKLINH